MKRTNVKSFKQFLNEDRIPGGLSDLRKPGEFNKSDLEQGIKIEMEHTSDPKIAEEIAMDHLTEDPNYYKKLTVMEQPGIKNYMFFNGLKNIKAMVDRLMTIDPVKIDELLNEHDWASNHMSTANDDITEIFQFMLSNLDREVHEDVRHEGDMWNVYIGKRLVGSFDNRKDARAKNDEYKKSKSK